MNDTDNWAFVDKISIVTWISLSFIVPITCSKRASFPRNIFVAVWEKQGDCSVKSTAAAASRVMWTIFIAAHHDILLWEVCLFTTSTCNLDSLLEYLTYLFYIIILLHGYILSFCLIVTKMISFIKGQFQLIGRIHIIFIIIMLQTTITMTTVTT